MPKFFRRLITWGVPIAIIAATIKNAASEDEGAEI
jgi:hypothetical protein